VPFTICSPTKLGSLQRISPGTDWKHYRVSREVFPYLTAAREDVCQLDGAKLELLLTESLRVAHESGALQSKDPARVTIDTTVEPKAIPDVAPRFPGATRRHATRCAADCAYLRVGASDNQTSPTCRAAVS
jgi:hypothetical protein